MAVDRSLPGAKPVAYYAKPVYRLDWEELAPEKKPYPFKEYWIVSHQGRHVGEFFGGKSGWWYGIIFGRFFIRRRSKDQVMHVLVSTICGPRA